MNQYRVKIGDPNDFIRNRGGKQVKDQAIDNIMQSTELRPFSHYSRRDDEIQVDSAAEDDGYAKRNYLKQVGF